MHVLLPCLCLGCSIWWSSLPELGQTISQPSSGLDIEGLREAINAASQEVGEASAYKEMIEAAEGAQNTEPREALSELPEYKSARAIAVMIGSIALAVILTGVAAKIREAY